MAVEGSLESIDVSTSGFENRQYAIVYPVTIMPREAVYSVYLEARKRAVQAGLAFLSPVGPRRLVVRQLRPQDLGLAGPEWRFHVMRDHSEIVRARVPEDMAIVIFGVYNQSPSPKVQQLEIWRNASRRLLLVLQELYTKGYDPMGVFAEFEVFRPGDEIRLVAWASSDGEEAIGLLGYVAEPEGVTVSREPP